MRRNFRLAAEQVPGQRIVYGLGSTPGTRICGAPHCLQNGDAVFHRRPHICDRDAPPEFKVT